MIQRSANTICLPKVNETRVDDIIWIEGKGNYSRFHFTRGHSVLVSHSLAYWQKKLPDFRRVHKSSLVNPLHIKAMHRNGGIVQGNGAVELRSGQRLEINFRRLSKVGAWQ
jgi:DNA-binding LytR/AlgR family response regulator